MVFSQQETSRLGMVFIHVYRTLIYFVMTVKMGVNPCESHIYHVARQMEPSDEATGQESTLLPLDAGDPIPQTVFDFA